MKYYVTWDGNGETYQEVFDNVSDAQKWAKAVSRGHWNGTVRVLNENGTVEKTYKLGFVVE